MTEDQITAFLEAVNCIRIVLCLILGVLLSDAMWRR